MPESEKEVQTWGEALEVRLTPLVLVFLFGVALQLLFFTYQPALKGPFVYDDVIGVVYNEDLRHPLEISRFFSDHNISLKFDRRPMTGISMMINYQLSGLDPGAFRLGNVLLHWFNAVILGLLIYQLSKEYRARCPKAFSLAIALLWLFHPLATSAVSFVFQRSEMLMSSFFILALLSMWQVKRSQGWVWPFLAFVCCVLSALSKETGLTTIAGVLLLDALVIEKSFKMAMMKRWKFYLCLSVAMAVLVFWIMTGIRMTELNQGNELSTPWGYFRYQIEVLLNYLRFVFWPDPLQFIYQPRAIPTISSWAPKFLFLLAVAVGFVFAGRKYHWVYLGIGLMLIILAPTTSILPIAVEPEIEFRMYLPMVFFMAAVVGLVVSAIPATYHKFFLPICLALLVLCSWKARERNHDYGSAAQLWHSVIEEQPLNVKAWVNLGYHYFGEGALRKARSCGENLLKVSESLGGNVPCLVNGQFLIALCEMEKGAYGKALASMKNLEDAEIGNLDQGIATCLLRMGKIDEAEDYFSKNGWTGNSFSQLCLRAERYIAIGKLNEAENVLQTLGETASDNYHVVRLNKRFNIAVRRAAVEE